ncbi:hypothetical protein PV04_04274 [Phialophora macrospora]|uniref:NmrA-like domain-containing protein n=1 Tax=Phialophora macrospora TaxID=1851006 RepID=A0A0D2CT13_9EURO|nr:hypothetical protein PV04_04274 [Phialophora macrospora]
MPPVRVDPVIHKRSLCSQPYNPQRRFKLKIKLKLKLKLIPMSRQAETLALPLPPRTRSILVIGAGELGLAIIHAILSHRLYSPATTTLTLMLRPRSLTHPSAEKAEQTARLRGLGVAIIPGDIEALSAADLTALLRPGPGEGAGYTAVLHAGGMTLAAGTMVKLTRAVLDARVPWYMPWQHGVDYDVIGPEAGGGLFREQVAVREMLRNQTHHTTDWVILSCGIFMSFLFEPFWRVVERVPSRTQAQAPAPARVMITALNSWDALITATAADDIGTATAEVLFSPDAPVNQPVYIAGETLTYGDLAATLARVLEPRGVVVARARVWGLEELKRESEMDDADKLKKYRLVFAEGSGVSWPKEETWSARRGIRMTGVEEWVVRQAWVDGL